MAWKFVPGRIPVATEARLKKKGGDLEEGRSKFFVFKEANYASQMTGNLIRLFFSETKQDQLEDIIRKMRVFQNGYYQDFSEGDFKALAKMVSHANVISRIITTQKKINLLRYKELCERAHIHIIRNWNWVLFDEAVHRLLDPSPELVLCRFTKLN